MWPSAFDVVVCFYVVIPPVILKLTCVKHPFPKSTYPIYAHSEELCLILTICLSSQIVNVINIVHIVIKHIGPKALNVFNDNMNNIYHIDNLRA